MIGHMDPFIMGNDFAEYEMRLQQFFIVNDVAEEKKVAFFITYIGANAYSVLRKLFSPDDPSSKRYKDLVDALKAYFAPSVNEIAESFKFYNAQQGEKSIREFIIELKAFAEKCNFGNFLDRALRDKFVCGVRDNQLRSKFLKESSLTFKKACELALSWEMAEDETREMCKKEFHNTCSIQESRNTSRNRNSGQKKKSYSSPKSCTRCGKRGHNSDQCFCKSWVCFHCNKKGHISSQCHSKKKWSS